jgi:hypothetical protein
MEITKEEMELVQKFLDTRDESLIRKVIEHPWAYSIEMIQIAIAIECGEFHTRMTCDNSALGEE